MKYLMVLALALLSLPTHAEGISRTELIRRCTALTAERRQAYPICDQVLNGASPQSSGPSEEQRLQNQINQPTAPVAPAPIAPAPQTSLPAGVVSREQVTTTTTVQTVQTTGVIPATNYKKTLPPEELQRRCLKLSMEVRRRYELCQAYWQEAPAPTPTAAPAKPNPNTVKALPKNKDDIDPILGEEPAKAQGSTYTVYGGYAALGGVTGFQAELERRSKHFGFSAFYKQQAVEDFEDTAAVTIAGSAFGVGVRYHLLPLWALKRKPMWDMSVYLHVGLSAYSGDTEAELPTYIYTAVGGDVSVPITKMKDSVISGYVDLGIHHIYHSSTNFLHLGGSAALGLKIDF